MPVEIDAVGLWFDGLEHIDVRLFDLRPAFSVRKIGLTTTQSSVKQAPSVAALSRVGRLIEERPNLVVGHDHGFALVG